MKAGGEGAGWWRWWVKINNEKISVLRRSEVAKGNIESKQSVVSRRREEERQGKEGERGRRTNFKVYIELAVAAPQDLSRIVLASLGQLM